MLEKNQCSVGVFYVLAGANGVVGTVNFSQFVLLGNRSVFGEPSLGAPAAVWDPVKDGRIEARAVDPRLTSGDNLKRGVHWGEVSMLRH